MMIPKRQRARSKAVRYSARGKECSLHIAGVCDYLTDTTCLAHIRMANLAGIGQKPSDFFAVYSCNACHAVIDDRPKPSITKEDKYFYLLRGLARTLESMHADGIITMRGK